MNPTPVTFDVPGGTLHGLRFGTGPRTVLAVHGITASAMAWPAVAAALPDDWSLVALDLRGRGASRELPGPFGLAAPRGRRGRRRRSRSGAATSCWSGTRWAPTSRCSPPAQRPELFTRLVLVDGGVPLPLPEGADPDEVLAATLGPALERLRTTYPSVEAYVDFFRAHPALGPSWDDTIEAYVRYDALETPRRRALPRGRRGGARRRPRPAAVAARELDRGTARADAADHAAGRAGRHVRRAAGPAARRGGGGVRRGGARAHRRDGAGHQPLHDPVRAGGRRAGGAGPCDRPAGVRPR